MLYIIIICWDGIGKQICNNNNIICVLYWVKVGVWLGMANRQKPKHAGYIPSFDSWLLALDVYWSVNGHWSPTTSLSPHAFHPEVLCLGRTHSMKSCWDFWSWCSKLPFSPPLPKILKIEIQIETDSHSECVTDISLGIAMDDWILYWFKQFSLQNLEFCGSYCFLDCFKRVKGLLHSSNVDLYWKCELLA